MDTLLLDWSGTLADDFPPTVYATNVVLEKYGLPTWTPEEFRNNFYLPYPKFYEEILPNTPLEELETVFRKGFSESPHPVTLLEHSLSFLQWAHQRGIKLIILTSMDTKNFEQQAKNFNVHHLFTDIYSGVLNKCDLIPEIILKHKLEPHKTAFVGDMVHDLEAATPWVFFLSQSYQVTTQHKS